MGFHKRVGARSPLQVFASAQDFDAATLNKVWELVGPVEEVY